MEKRRWWKKRDQQGQSWTWGAVTIAPSSVPRVFRPPVPHVRDDGRLGEGEIRQKEFSLTGKCEVRLSSSCRLWEKNWQEFPCREKTDECLQQRRQLQTDFGPAGRAGGGGSGASFDRFSPVVILSSPD